MSKEKDLLQRVRDVLRGLKETHYELYWDIQTALDQPEQEPEAWILKEKETGYKTQVAYRPSVLKKGWEAIPLYPEPPKPEQEPVAWITEWVQRYRHNDTPIIDRAVSFTKADAPAVPNPNYIPLYLAPRNSKKYKERYETFGE
jgi:hypothetical protein